ncbi:MAG: aminotransferase class IV family protein [Cyclobacteriaceae bacterium]|nr:aminotransferase class IV family protein [Cyclobacteriaceae bacterium]
MGEYFFLNGKILPASEAVLKITDLALLRGFGIFDFMRTYRQKPFMIDHYLRRFFNSARLMDLEIPLSKEEITEIIMQLLERNRIFEAGIRMVLTGGYTSNGYTPAEPNFFILIEKINFPPQSSYENGIRLYFYQHQREFSQIKSINYLSPILLRKRIEAANAFDVLYHFNDQVLEVSRSNFFIIRDQKVITPDTNVLPGITRSSVIHMAREYCTVEERPLPVDELWQADEAFMTGTTKKVLPVVQVGDHIIGSGSPGPATRKLTELFKNFEDSHV